MRVKASSPGKFVDLRERCGNMSLKADCLPEEQFLSAIHAVFIHGGTVTVKPKKDKPIKMTWDRD
jgi:hypothetical protein